MPKRYSLALGRSHWALAGLAALAFSVATQFGARAEQTVLHFAVGPFQPTLGETKKAYEPFFAYIADRLGATYDLQVTTDWAGVATALANDQADVAWMGPWGYVLANNQGGARAIATVKYDGKPTYHAIVVGRPGLGIKNWPQDAKGMRISFADVGSTSGWLIPTYWFKSRGIDPKVFFKYRDGAAHPANELAVANGQVDLATDYDRNRQSMIEHNTIAADATEVVWTSDPLPNDPITVRKGLDLALTEKIQHILLAIDPATAQKIMPVHYTGFIAATHDSYRDIEAAGLALGLLKSKTAAGN